MNLHQQCISDASKSWSVDERLLLFIAVTVSLIVAFLAIRFSAQPLIEAFGFRQTQTALTAYWILREGPALAYQTPVAGAPWAIPFELPIYQTVVAGIARLTGSPLGPVGRVVSCVFLLAGMVPIFAIARRLQLSRAVALVFVCLWLSSPLYVFWGRGFMVETAALFFVLAALPFAINLISDNARAGDIVGTGTFLALAMLQKITTAGPVLLALGLLWIAVRLRRERGIAGVTVREWIGATLALGLPFLVAIAWTQYSDAIKMSNALGAQLTSSALWRWNFGDLGQRFSPELLVQVIWHRVMFENVGGLFGLALIAGAVFFSGDKRLRRLIYVCSALFLLPLLIFSNLHIVHSYYQMSCALFAIGALAIAVGAWVPRIVKHSLVVPAVTALLVVSNFAHFWSGYWGTMTARFPLLETRVLAVAEVLRRYTAPDSAFVAFGADWSSELTYYAQRKSFTVPEWFAHYHNAWLSPESYLGGMKLAAIVGCPVSKRRMPSPEQIMRRLDSDSGWLLVEVQDCLILVRHEASIL